MLPGGNYFYFLGDLSFSCIELTWPAFLIFLIVERFPSLLTDEGLLSRRTWLGAC